jgi:hypothetical protein
VLFIAGAGRSGSTLLDGILGQLDGFFAAGELRYLWERGLQEGRLCGCGVPVRDCPIWRAVLASAFGPGVDANAAAELQRQATRARRAPAMILSGRLGRRRPGRLAAALGPLYQAIRESTGCRVLVDSSKLPSYGALLEALPGVELYVLHLVRDPRATAWSWLRRKRLTDTPAPRLMQRQPPGKSAAMWMVWNLTAALLWSGGPRYLRLRYEDLVRRPEAAVRRIAELVGESPAALPFPVPGRVALAPTHSVAGNPGRLDTGEVALRLDDEWSSRLRPRHRLVVTLATWPLLRHYRYRVTRRGGTIRWD